MPARADDQAGHRLRPQLDPAQAGVRPGQPPGVIGQQRLQRQPPLVHLQRLPARAQRPRLPRQVGQQPGRRRRQPVGLLPLLEQALQVVQHQQRARALPQVGRDPRRQPASRQPPRRLPGQPQPHRQPGQELSLVHRQVVGHRRRHVLRQPSRRQDRPGRCPHRPSPGPQPGQQPPAGRQRQGRLAHPSAAQQAQHPGVLVARPPIERLQDLHLLGPPPHERPRRLGKARRPRPGVGHGQRPRCPLRQRGGGPLGRRPQVQRRHCPRPGGQVRFFGLGPQPAAGQRRRLVGRAAPGQVPVKGRRKAPPRLHQDRRLHRHRRRHPRVQQHPGHARRPLLVAAHLLRRQQLGPRQARL